MQSLDPGQNFFELFGLSPVFDIDLACLHDAQRRLQASYHPDRFVGSTDQDKRLSVQMASRVNQAYETLRDPVKRSRYLLEINGARLPDDSETTSDTTFLMEQIELREELESCRHAEDALDRCDRIEARLARRADELAGEFVDCFEAKAFEDALESSRKMQFIQRIQHHLSELQYELEEN
ncbi:MAG: Fe-S protein assembly co-chaperone HscB [Gammaproteobacteria bacterium]|nr:Fe-S protein assembly co-chaperone HscB [Gammaproteobacteria bacterium]MDH3447265.1 Fe-S protein assembly co-chaperone HscB [Gammaproteobacteria bacterium]